jgi:hypothetical protein
VSTELLQCFWKSSYLAKRVAVVQSGAPVCIALRKIILVGYSIEQGLHEGGVFDASCKHEWSDPPLVRSA